MDREGRGARDKRRDVNDAWQAGHPDREYKSSKRKNGGGQGPGQVDHGRLKARVAIATIVFVGLGLVAMDQASEQAENENRYNGQRNDWEALTNALFWIAGYHAHCRARGCLRPWVCIYTRNPQV